MRPSRNSKKYLFAKKHIQNLTSESKVLFIQGIKSTISIITYEEVFS